jgi:hypothetical protein
LAKKHKKEMEDYIKNNLQEHQAVSNGAVNEGQFKSTADIEKEMYSELLATDTGAKNVENTNKEGDVGAGGAVMGGTGIAEVTLPIDDRIKAIKETERAAMEYEKARKARLGIIDQDDEARARSAVALDTRTSELDDSALAAMVPMNFASGPGKRKRKEITKSESMIQAPQQKSISTFDPTKDFQYPFHSSAIPAGSFIERNNDTTNLGASYSHNFAQHNRDWIEEKKTERQAEIDALAAQNAEDGPEESKARVGFDVARKLARGEAGDTSSSADAKGTELRNEWDRKQGSNDDRVMKAFMSNQKNRR